MSEKDKHILDIVRQVLNEELKGIVSILQANQPTETSRMTRLVSETIEKSLVPVKEHLNNQDVVINDIQNSHNDFKKDLEPIIKAFKDSENTKVVVDKIGTRILTGAKNVGIIGGALASVWVGLKIIGNLIIQK